VTQQIQWEVPSKPLSVDDPLFLSEQEVPVEIRITWFDPLMLLLLLRKKWSSNLGRNSLVVFPLLYIKLFELVVNDVVLLLCKKWSSNLGTNSLVVFPLLYIKLFELVVKVAVKNQSAVTHHKVDLFKFPL
jgi:hypothetical protein